MVEGAALLHVEKPTSQNKVIVDFFAEFVVHDSAARADSRRVKNDARVHPGAAAASPRATPRHLGG